MTFTVRSLLDAPRLGTKSLTPGVGEDRRITRAHVCELAEPWQWIGDGALVMTTGIGVPAEPDAQCAYLTGLQAAGISAITIDAEMPAVPFSLEALEHAVSLGFPVLQTAFDVPFVSLAEAVAEAAYGETLEYLRLTERMYTAFAEHAVDAGIDALLHDLGQILGGSLKLLPQRRSSATGAVRRSSPDVRSVPILAPRPTELHFTSDTDIDDGLLQCASGIVGSALSVKAATRRSEWLHSAALLSELCEGGVGESSAEHLVGAYGVHPSYVFAVCQTADARTALDNVRASFASRRVASLATVVDGQVLILTTAGSAAERRFATLAQGDTRLGVSAPFALLGEVPNALLQARGALIRNPQSGRVLRFEEHEPGSLFLPNDGEQLRSIAHRVLGPLFTYDEQRGTSLTHTLRLFLEENRSWVRASERLFVHRQTLIARISRIEKIIDRDLSSMEDTAACWLAVQAAITSGDLDAHETRRPDRAG